MSNEHKTPPPDPKLGQQAPHGLRKTGDITIQAADEPFPQPEDAPDAQPWEKGEFRRKVMEAGFPGSPGSDPAFLSALYHFVHGKAEQKAEPKTEPKTEHKGEHKPEHK